MGEGRQGISERREVILRIIADAPVYTQTELIRQLKKQGFDVTQATVSRDIRELQLVKKPDADGRSVYTAPETGRPAAGNVHHGAFPSFGDAVLSVTNAGNIIVIKTSPGMAQAVCAAMDRTDREGILGTIAGDDTIFAAAESESRAAQAALELKEFWK